ncbi:MAG: hypothetical protein ACPGRW_06310 [Flavobacteriaceae bacterium]
MADNFKQTVNNIEVQIDPNGAVGSIKALNHQNILKDILNKVGKYSGLPYVANKNLTGTYSNGQMSFNNHSLNSTGNLTFSLAKKNADNLDIATMLGKLTQGDIIVFKDFVGRAAQFLFVSFVANNTKGSYDLTVTAITDNINYTYQDTEVEICVFSFLTSAPSSMANDIITLSGTRFKLCKKASNPTQGVPEVGDFVANGRLEDALILYAEYNTGDIHNFGTLANNFTDGSYTKVKYVK